MKKITETERIVLHQRRPAQHPETFRVDTEGNIPKEAHTGDICYVENPVTWRGTNAKLWFNGLEWVFIQCGEVGSAYYTYRGTADTLDELNTDEEKAKAQAGDVLYCKDCQKFMYWNDTQKDWYEVNLPVVVKRFEQDSDMSIEEWNKQKGE